jgi:hypothetical protein
VKTDLLPYGAVSRLYIANASQRDAGNYTCNISESSWTTVVVHILNGRVLFVLSLYIPQQFYSLQDVSHLLLLARVLGIGQLSSGACKNRRNFLDNYCGIDRNFFFSRQLSVCFYFYLYFYLHTDLMRRCTK